MTLKNWASARVACLDDEEQVLDLISRSLPEFDLQPFSCSDRFLTEVDGTAECILLDIHMPQSEHSGYDICRYLRQNSETRHTPIIFISANHQLEHRLEGYAAGADDFIAKPFDLQELRVKVERAVLHHNHHMNLENQADAARQTAFEAMTHSAEQGEISRFIEQAGSVINARQLFQLLITTLKNFGLNAVVSSWLLKPALSMSHHSEVKPLELDLLQNCRRGKRIVELDRRMIINFEQASVLIKNAPWQDASRYGRMKDHLCVLMSAVNERMVALKTEQRLQHQSILLQAVGDLRGMLEKTQRERALRFDEAQHKVSDLEMELKEELLLLNLDRDQEEHMLNLVRQHVRQLDECYRGSTDIQKELKPVLEGLEQAAQASQLV